MRYASTATSAASGDDATPIDALADFQRFPPGCGATRTSLDFVGWLRAHNDDAAAPSAQVGFYGLDLY